MLSLQNIEGQSRKDQDACHPKFSRPHLAIYIKYIHTKTPFCNLTLLGKAFIFKKQIANIYQCKIATGFLYVYT